MFCVLTLEAGKDLKRRGVREGEHGPGNLHVEVAKGKAMEFVHDPLNNRKR